MRVKRWTELVDTWPEGRLNKKKKAKSTENLKEMDSISIVSSSSNNEARDDRPRMIKQRLLVPG